jgi:hypothetical protein
VSKPCLMFLIINLHNYVVPVATINLSRYTLKPPWAIIHPLFSRLVLHRVRP